MKHFLYPEEAERSVGGIRSTVSKDESRVRGFRKGKVRVCDLEGTMTDTDDQRAPAQEFNEVGKGFLPGLLGIAVTGTGEGWVEARLAVRRELMAPNGFLHAGSVITLADTCCGYGCVRALPEGAAGFTTVELKSNFLGTAREGIIVCRAEALHLGRTTQLWDAKVTNEATGKTMALFRCTQMVLWPRG